MLQIKILILDLFLLVLRIRLDFSLDAGYKSSRFSKTLLKEGHEFVSNKKNGIAAFNLDLILLLAKIDSILVK